MFEINIIIVILCSAHADQVDVKFDANVDLPNNWSYEFKPALKTSPDLKKAEKYDANEQDHMFINNIADSHGARAKDDTPYNLLQKIQDAVNNVKNIKSTIFMQVTKPDKQELFVEPRKVKHDAQITEFTKHIYKQSLQVFDAIKVIAVDDKMKKEVDFLAKNYEEKFGEFVRETQNQKIKTRLGRQKVIMNTLETSNLILKRLVNYLVGMDKDVLRSESASVIQNEVNKKMDIENSHICKKFGICRSRSGFSDFFIEAITIVLSADDKKIIQARDALTEAVKYSQFTHFMNPDTEKHFQKGISDIEGYDVPMLKSILHIVKNVLLHKNKPIKVIGEVDKRVNKTVGALEMIDAFETALPPNEENQLAWMDIKNSLTEWKDDKRHDITEIAQSFVDHVNKGTEKFDQKVSYNFERNTDLLLGFL